MPIENNVVYLLGAIELLADTKEQKRRAVAPNWGFDAAELPEISDPLIDPPAINRRPSQIKTWSFVSDCLLLTGPAFPHLMGYNHRYCLIHALRSALSPWFIVHGLWCEHTQCQMASLCGWSG